MNSLHPSVREVRSIKVPANLLNDRALGVFERSALAWMADCLPLRVRTYLGTIHFTRCPVLMQWVYLQGSIRAILNS